jgi:hypothetical protein
MSKYTEFLKSASGQEKDALRLFLQACAGSTSSKEIVEREDEILHGSLLSQTLWGNEPLHDIPQEEVAKQIIKYARLSLIEYDY